VDELNLTPVLKEAMICFKGWQIMHHCLAVTTCLKLRNIFHAHPIAKAPVWPIKRIKGVMLRVHSLLPFGRMLQETAVFAACIQDELSGKFSELI